MKAINDKTLNDFWGFYKKKMLVIFSYTQTYTISKAIYLNFWLVNMEFINFFWLEANTS